MKNCKKILAYVLTFLLILTMMACNSRQAPSPTKVDSGTGTAGTADSGKYPNYLNLNGYRPIVKEGNNVTLSMVVRRDTIANSEMKKQWMAQFIQQKFNIKLDIEELFQDTYAERRNLMFASNDLKDIIINVGLTPNNLVTYGMVGHQLLPMNDYINPNLTPTLKKALDAEPLAAMSNTTPDGKMYSVTGIADSYEGYGNTIGTVRVFYNKNWLDAAKVSVPKTVDEYVEMLRAFKKLDPAKVGAKTITPMISANGHDKKFLFNAFGWIGDNNDGVEPAFDYNKKSIVIPCGEPSYAEYIKIMNTLYSEGLIHKDYFTMDRAAARALLAEGNAGVCSDSAPYLSVPNKFKDYIAATPLTSKWSPKPVTNKSKTYGTGDLVISANTKYPEVAMRLVDYFYTEEGSMYSYHGPAAGSPDTLGIVSGFKLNDSKTYIVYDDVLNKKRESDYDYRVNSISLSQNTPRVGLGNNLYLLKTLGVSDPKNPKMNMNDPDDHYRQIVFDAQKGCLVDMLPIAFLPQDKMTKAGDLLTVISNYAKAETAKFIVGQRPLSELDNYFAELKKLGIDEYRNIYADAYKDYLSKLK